MIKSLSADGKITLEGGQVVRINDPNAVFSAGYGSHPEFTADDANPSVTGKKDCILGSYLGLTNMSHSFQWLPHVRTTLVKRRLMPLKQPSGWPNIF